MGLECGSDIGAPLVIYENACHLNWGSKRSSANIWRKPDLSLYFRYKILVLLIAAMKSTVDCYKYLQPDSDIVGIGV